MRCIGPPRHDAPSAPPLVRDVRQAMAGHLSCRGLRNIWERYGDSGPNLDFTSWVFMLFVTDRANMIAC